MSNFSKFMNNIPMLILTSPLHPIMSRKYMVIQFRGRKSGKVYKTPLAYVREGDTVLLSTDSPWWKNFRGGAPVTVILRGQTMSGTGRPIQDPQEAAAILRKLVDAIPSYAKPAELKVENGRVSDEEIARSVAESRVSLIVDLAPQR